MRLGRVYPEYPMVGVGAIIFRGSEVLLVQRGGEPGYGKWSIPGGLVEVGESLQEAVEREVWEEVGLRVHAKDLTAVLDRVIPDENGRPRYHYVLLDFLCEYRGGDPKPATDVLQCAFTPVGDLDRFTMTAGTQEVVLRAQNRLRGEAVPFYDPTL